MIGAVRAVPARLALAVGLGLACAAIGIGAQEPAPSDPVAQLQSDIAAAIAAPGVQRGIWGVVVQSLTTDERLVDINPRALLVPGSLAKLVSVATASDAVGWEYRFPTMLRATGPVVEGVLRGDLLVVGSGDPSIGGPAGENPVVLVQALKALGITRIDGRVIGDDDDLEDPRPQLAWAWDDLGYRAGAIFGALNLNENVMVVTVVPSASEGDATTLSVDPSATDRPLVNRSVTGARGSRLLLWPEQRPGETALTIAGSIPAGAAPFRLTVSVGNPTAWFANVLRRRLILEGIDVTGGAFDIDEAAPGPNRAASTLLHTQYSPPLAALVQPLLKDSLNLYGEALLRLNAPPDGPRTNDAALIEMAARLDGWGVTPESQQIIDGSGLSRRNVIAPEAVLTLLRRMYDPTGQSPFMTGLAVAGVDGSLEGRMKGTAAQGTVRAKTGTMTNIRSLAGYATTPEGEVLAFVVMVNNFEGGPRSALDAIDAVAIRLASFRRQSL
jgi:D-alanyl-D-alanine carboxypeptidase/D-alanyl-D-alanine-endopeptidase (penicillin-binding protein 4)